ncbi:hypothetical protein SKAU_G00006730 [Synaphobranchus kaupii]|uniref:Uncharacterized protein n=1 Tax=Synaphobranchus kaupii TaxID=118154 RepID=A0A9Q1G979_SYNKA|nr:hypothetical protein SKAU_G00006730 [Synaphobranchus kaupii]
MGGNLGSAGSCSRETLAPSPGSDRYPPHRPVLGGERSAHLSSFSRLLPKTRRGTNTAGGQLTGQMTSLNLSQTLATHSVRQYHGGTPA